MFSIIGGVDRGEFAGSILALDYVVSPPEFVAFACWTPHRFSLSIEQNTIPRALADAVVEELVDEMRLEPGDGLAERFFDHDYVRVVKGPHEGHLVELAADRAGLSAGEIDLVNLTARVPLVKAMSGSASVSADLLERLHDVASARSSSREVEGLLRHCVNTVDWRSDDRSPDMALKMWFAELRQSHHDAPRNERPARLRDAARMARAVTTRERFWVSGDWGPGLTRILGLAISSLRSGGKGEA